MHPSERVSDRGAGGALFASVVMIVGGVMAALQGVAGILKDGVYFVRPADYWITISSASWGWTHLAAGLLLVAAGIGVLSGATWARWTGIVVASLCAVVNFLFIPYMPFWSMTLIALDVWVIYALAVHKREPEMIYLHPGEQAATQPAPRTTTGT